MGAPTGYASSPGQLPTARARGQVCRRTGCLAPAERDGLCEVHALDQKRRLAVAVATPVGPTSTRTTLNLSALADIARAREARWRQTAACRGQNRLMYPAHGQGTAAADYAPALALCGACPAVEPCRAAGAREPDGVWGASTPADRRRSRRRP